MANKAVGYSARALEAHPHRPDPYEQEEILTRKLEREAEKQRRAEEARLKRESQAESPGAPWIYMPGLLSEGRSERAERKRAASSRAAHRVVGRVGKSGGTPAWIFWFQILLIISLLSIPALAVEPREVLADPALEARARAISQELRCLVCQNQSIDDSNAPLAADLRRLVRDRLTAGDSDDAVLAFVTQRYGDYVLLRPPFQVNTLLLWGTPLAVLGLGGLGVALWFRGRTRTAAPQEAPLSAEEQRSFALMVGLEPGTQR